MTSIKPNNKWLLGSDTFIFSEIIGMI